MGAVGYEYEVWQRGDEIPHAYKVLHHELVEGLRWVGHINLPRSVPKISLRVRSFSDRYRGVSGHVPFL